MKHFTLKIKQLFAAMMLFACIPASAQFTATVEQYAKSDYITTAAEFKLSEIATTLGTDTATLVAALDVWATDTVDVPEMFFLKVGEELTDNYTQGSQGGFWISRAGTVGSWGVDAVYYNQIWWDNESNADKFYIELGQFPDSLKAGATFNPTFVMKHGDKQATFDITYIVKELVLPEVELDITKLEIVGEAEATAEQYPRINYNSSPVYVNIAGAAEKLGVDAEVFETLIPAGLYRPYVDATYGIKVDSLTLATNNGGWGRVVLDAATGDTLTEVCAAPWAAEDQFYIDTYAFANDTLSCNIGQYPSNLKVGDTFYSYVYIVYGSKAYRVKYTLNIVEDPNAATGDLETMNKVGSEIIRISQQPTTDYSYSAIMLNTDSIAELLGCAVGDMTFQAIDNNGALSTSSTANNGGYWMTQGGIICGWGTNAYFFVEPAASNDYSQLNVGQMPGNTAIGEEGHTLMYLTSGNNYYELDITLAIEQGEAVVQDFESVATRNYTVQAIDATYAWSEIANSASIPFADIYNLIGTTEPVLYALNIDSIAAQKGEKYSKNYTINEKPGFWLTEDGCQGNWGNNAPWGITGLNSTADNFILQCMQMDGYGVVGDVYTGQFFLVNEENNKMLTINLTYQIVETIIQAEIVGEEWINLPVSMDDASVDYDLTKVATAFGLESVDALFEGYYVKGLKADGTYTEGLDAIESGVILNTSGAADTYGDIGVGFSEDYKQIWTYSNVDIEAPFKAEATICFEIDTKRYVIHITLLDPESYEAAQGIAGINADKKDGKIYNLQGQEVAAPAKGIYIKDGKKFLVK